MPNNAKAVAKTKNKDDNCEKKRLDANYFYLHCFSFLMLHFGCLMYQRQLKHRRLVDVPWRPKPQRRRSG